MAASYLTNGDYAVRKEMERVSKDYKDPNKSYALEWARFLELHDRKSRTVAKRLHELRFILDSIGKDAKKCDRKDIERLVLAINKGTIKGTDTALADISKVKIKQTLKSFYRWLYDPDADKHTFPAVVKWIEIKHIIKPKMADEMLTQEEVNTLIMGCMNERDRCLLAVMFDSGARIGELLNLRVGDINITKDGLATAKLSGKTGTRMVYLTYCVPFLSSYLNTLKHNAKPGDWLFNTFDHKRLTNVPLDYIHVRKLLIDLKARTKIEKRINPHTWRHSRATMFARNNINPQLMKQYFGWTPGSNTASTYTHLNDRDLVNAVMEVNGMRKPDEKKHLPGFKTCIKCKEVNEYTNTYCKRCACPLDAELLVQESEKRDRELADIKAALNLLVERLDSETKAKVMKIFED